MFWGIMLKRVFPYDLAKTVKGYIKIPLWSLVHRGKWMTAPFKKKELDEGYCIFPSLFNIYLDNVSNIWNQILNMGYSFHHNIGIIIPADDNVCCNRQKMICRQDYLVCKKWQKCIAVWFDNISHVKQN